MPSKKQINLTCKKSDQNCPIEDVIEKKLEDISTILYSADCGKKSRLYEDIMLMVERSLLKIALRRSNYVKSSAAAYLGISRNTLQSKMLKMGISCEDSRQEKG